ncbi:aspartate-semialdehyde dehydrogenase [Psychrobacillus sp. INOP01]|uniref:aspartate-semialdehyde dehydrogenase n=1 Tax=Psychrobacillus sp. INOP01 TaxID=2829187 RepID=UPI001BAC00D4|nr:aspartate-semialdehyde dehydrogenase [Psychrobacillus sp. INOP01]QUG41136.1 aspartate-semialdehyde dehydrogenase [Psychrobacillus sp. INOP01]
MSQGYTVAIVGATGAVGQKIIEKLVERSFPYTTLKLLASKKSAGKQVEVNGSSYTIEEATPEAFEGVDVAFFSAGGSISKALAKEASNRGAIVIDNTSAFRMDKDTPLVVPEVNKQALHEQTGIIANPNCSTIQMVCALEPIRQKFGLNKVIVSTYQAVSGAGAAAISELTIQSEDLKNKQAKPEILPVKSAEKHYPIAGNVIPQIDIFTEDGFTFEEHKMMNETKKIMSLPNLAIAATCVRVPVVTGHSESVYVEVEQENVTLDQVKQLLSATEGITLQDAPDQQLYPMPYYAEDKDDVFVGRLRKDPSNDKGFHMWIVSDNLLKGAALNSIQIAEALISEGILKEV